MLDKIFDIEQTLETIYDPLSQIMVGYLKQKDFLNLYSTCKNYYKICQDPKIWDVFHHRDYLQHTNKVPGKTYQEKYIFHRFIGWQWHFSRLF